MAFDSTVGGPSANSYVTVARAAALLPVLVSPSRAAAWGALVSSVKEGFLMRACNMMERYFDWTGCRTNDGLQVLAWPRDFVYPPDSATALPADLVPQRVEEAQSLLALYLSEGFEASDQAEAPLSAMRISALSMKFETNKAARSTALLPPEVIEVLRGFGEYVGATGLGRSVTLERG